VSLRLRLLAGSILLVLLPLSLLTVGIRFEMQKRLTQQFRQRVDALSRAAIDALDDAAAGIEIQLETLAEACTRDNRLRLALLSDGGSERAYLLDFAEQAMRLLALDMLQLRTFDGTILSSGHYRGEYEQRDPGLVSRLMAAGTSALVPARGRDGPFLALARAAPLTIGDRTYHLVGGRRVDRAWLERLTPDPQLAVTLVHRGGAISSDPQVAQLLDGSGGRASDATTAAGLVELGYWVRVEPVPLVSGRDQETALLVVSHPRAPLAAVMRGVDLWLALALAATAAGAVVLAAWSSVRISRPLRDLTGRTRRLDLDRLDVDFATGRSDEVGQLSRVLQALTDRLRASLARAREAERRATLGDVARQVNHDIRNGLTPLRNVLRHLGEVAAASPASLARVYTERLPTLAASLEHLEKLAGHYQRLAHRGRPESCDLVALASAAVDAVRGAPSGGRAGGAPVRFRFEAVRPVPAVAIDPVSFRRILDNLLRNALESLSPTGGTVTVRVEPNSAAVAGGGPTETVPNGGENAERADESAPAGVLVSVEDTGCGIATAELDRVFDDFYTTKPAGSGLGLSNVRRLVADSGGTISVASEPDVGTTVSLHFPGQEPRS
jgi:signal transduction histidine kinase